jgi:hypothetical protein
MSTPSGPYRPDPIDEGLYGNPNPYANGYAEPYPQPGFIDPYNPTYANTPDPTPYPQQVDYSGYMPTPMPYYPPRPRATNTMAIASLISSILGFTAVPLIGSIVGVILGHIALSQISETGDEGHGLAVAGLVIGYGVIALAIFGLLLFFMVAVSIFH